MSHERAGKAVFVDRDGVLNRSTVRGGKPYAPRRLEEFRLLPGAAASLRALKSAGYAVVVVTNQPDIGNGLIAREIVEAMHARLRARAPVDAIEMCSHRQDEGCDCRKPRPGMLLNAARRLRLSLPDSIVVGDRAGDVAAGKAAGCRTVFVDRGYAETGTIEPDAKARSLPEAVRLILAGRV
jgi:D-glycero-D-manno-heptose 1,7-bisphosphate phosphatase